MQMTKVSLSDLDKFVHLDLQVAELLLLQSLLADVSQGLLPDRHFDEKHHNFYVQFFYHLDSLIGEVIKHDKKDKS